ncbi:MAG: aminopeptidase P family protein [Saprospiraceae bacterium]|nr:aminopeptidase P family protein [Saprospiraceae bacterium]
MEFHLFSAETYRKRRENLVSNFDRGLIWLPGNSEAPMNYPDNTYHFRQDSNFLYYAGVDLPDLSLLIDVAEGKTYLCGDNRSIELVVWMGPQPSLQEIGKRVGIENTLTSNQLLERLKKAVQVKEEIHFLPPYRGLTIIKIAHWLDRAIKDIKSGASLQLIEAVIGQRSVKEEQELKQMEIALSITRDMHLEVMYEARVGRKESELMAGLMAVMYRENVNLAYPVILTVNGQTLHNHDHSHVLQEGQLLLGDFGAECPMHYAGDITRTVPANGVFNERQKEIYQIVLEGQKTAIEMMAPGIPYRDVHLAAARKMTEGLIAMGLMKGDVDEAVQNGAHALFFPHGLGHMIGLDVHDMEDLGEDLLGYDGEVKRSAQFGLRSLRYGKKLSEGNVLTVEPGLYFIPELIDIWADEKKNASFICYNKLEPFRDFGGIRIEDNFAITETGTQLLGPAIPKETRDIEFLMSADRLTG